MAAASISNRNNGASEQSAAASSKGKPSFKPSLQCVDLLSSDDEDDTEALPKASAGKENNITKPNQTVSKPNAATAKPKPRDAVVFLDDSSDEDEEEAILMAKKVSLEQSASPDSSDDEEEEAILVAKKASLEQSASPDSLDSDDDRDVGIARKKTSKQRLPNSSLPPYRHGGKDDCPKRAAQAPLVPGDSAEDAIEID